jgi:hypothetical protein
MRTITYYSSNQITLNNIALEAQKQGFETQWIKPPVNHPTEKTYLNIILGSIEKGEWSQWSEMTIDELWFETDGERERLKSLNPSTYILFECNLGDLKKILSFLKPIVVTYGGWLDCRGDTLELYTAENIDNILQDCL